MFGQVKSKELGEWVNEKRPTLELEVARGVRGSGALDERGERTKKHKLVVTK